MAQFPESGSEFLAAYAANLARLEAAGAGDLDLMRDGCGVGCVVAIDGQPRREVVLKGIEALKAVWHRGAVDADGKTGDGAGIHVQIPQDFFKKKIKGAGRTDQRIAVGMIFLPRNSLGQQEACRTLVESEILRFGYTIRGWRQVPVDTTALGEKAQATRPEIEQIVIANSRGGDDDAFERDLYLIRRRIEKQALLDNITDFYICSLSCRSIIYKGLFLAEALAIFYPDLNDERFISSFAVFHQRYSTNTLPSWRLAQPFRVLAHNGEINTLRGNVNWMKSHETRMVAEAFGTFNDDIKPLIQAGSSDSAALDAVFEALVRAGRQLPLVKTLMIPPSWSHRTAMKEEHRDLFNYCNCVMEPWDGPAAHVATDSRWVVAGLDRNGLRPLRYSRTRDGLLVVGSETGMVPIDELEVVEKGRVGPGGAIAVDLVEGRFYGDQELKDYLADLKPYSRWVKNITHLDETVRERSFRPTEYERTDLRRRQAVYGFTIEDMELILSPMVQDAKEAVGSMGDDTPLAVLSRQYRGLHHFFRQQFSQVTNPPIDPLREWRVMSLKTRYGNLGNIFDEDPSQTTILQLESPVSHEHRARGGGRLFRPGGTHHRLHLPGRARDLADRGPRADPAGGRGRRARRLAGAGAERRAGLGRAGADPDDPRRRCRAQPSRQAGPARLQLDHRPLGRVPGRALLRRADRGRRHRRSTPTWRRPRSPTGMAAACLRA